MVLLDPISPHRAFSPLLLQVVAWPAPFMPDRCSLSHRPTSSDILSRSSGNLRRSIFLPVPVIIFPFFLNFSILGYRLFRAFVTYILFHCSV
jgi:hypothetical protein